MDILEKVEILREKANISYEEAKNVLEAANGDLLDAMERNITEDTAAYDNFRLAQLKIEYAMAIGNRKKLRQGYEERNQYYEQYQQDRNLVYHESIVLMGVTDDLHREHARIQEENARLLKIAETDMLANVSSDPNSRSF